ncbi:MAG: hypothetical protein IJ767_02395 [Bacteroidaceae bacterium]|nr:hypothetical protein [Bacteroidaceae bacterium]
MNRFLFLFLFVLTLSSASAQRHAPRYREGVPTDSIRLSDPFILADSASQTYYMTGTGGLLWTSNDVLPSAPTRRQRPDGSWPNRVTDGPWLFRTESGRLGCLWTSWAGGDYTMGVAYSRNGTLDGPWEQQPQPITPPNYGHGMLFRDWMGHLLLVLHHHEEHDGHYIRTPHYFLMDDEGNRLRPIANFKP